MADYFPGHTVLNRGFGGAQLHEVLHFADRIVLPYAPRVIVLNAGGNDVGAGKTPAQIREAARAFAARVRAALPGARILHVSLPPTRRAIATPGGLEGLRALNALLASVAQEEKHLEFIDIVPAFLGADGLQRAELFVADGTHFSPAGFAVLAGLIKARL